MRSRPSRLHLPYAPSLSAEANRDLARRRRDAIAAGDDATARAIRDEMEAGNRSIVLYRAARSQGRGIDLGDLIQEGTIGLLTAIERYDPDRAAFTTFADYWILQQIRRAIYEQANVVRVPVYHHSKWPDRLPVNPRYRELASRAMRVSSLDAGEVPPDRREDLAIVDDGPERVEDADRDRLLAALVASLAPLHRDVLRLRYGLDGPDPDAEPLRTYREIGERLGCSRSSVQAREQKALRQLRERFGLDPRTGRAGDDDSKEDRHADPGAGVEPANCHRRPCGHHRPGYSREECTSGD